MKFNFFLLILLACSCQLERKPKSTTYVDLVKYVDPQIGSVHGRWFFYTPAAVPFGMAKLAPHTNAYNSSGGWGPTGYDDRHTSIEGFGHFHEFQVGGLTFMPITGSVQTMPGTLEDPDRGYRSRFEKSTEIAEPGYYQVLLSDYDIKVELTATERSGLQRYTFTSPGTSHLVIDIGHRQGESGEVTYAQTRLVGGKEIAGYIETYPEYLKFCDPEQRVTMYFVSRFSQPVVAAASFVDSLLMPESDYTEGSHNGMVLDFNLGEQGGLLEIQTGLSYTSLENARINLDREIANKSFDQVRKEARLAWNEQLNRIEVKGGKEVDRTKFYTGLYHALLGRGLASDINGQYPKINHEIGQIPLDEKGEPRYHHYNSDGMWGGFWNLSQLWALAYPEYLSDYIQSNIDLYQERGWLHDGVANSTYTNGVQTNFQGLLIASAYNVGIRDFDVQSGYQAALKNELVASGRNLGNGKYDLHYFLGNKYVPYKDTVISNGWVFNFGSSHTLEYAFSSYAVGQMAKSMNDQPNYLRLSDQATYFRNLFDPETRLMRPKFENGLFISDFDPMKAWDGFQEGNAWQYTWYVPHDPAALIELVGDSLFNARLENMFVDAEENQFGSGTDEIHSFSAIEKLYNHGNQPSLHNAWLFNYSGRPWLTQKWVRSIADHFYGNDPLHGYGVGQDEDQGQLGAWYVMAALGLFDVQGHSSAKPSLQLSAPFFDQIIIQLDQQYFQGAELIIEKSGSNPDDLYIQSVTWNGQEISNCWIYREALMKGGRLVFTLGSEPNEKWGVKIPPPSMSNEK